MPLRESVTAKHLRDIALLPGMVAFVIPVLIVRWTGGPWAFADVPSAVRAASIAIGVTMLAAGVAMFVWTVSLFARVGRGTLAPWQPTQRLVVRGPYRHVRNPMITSVLTVLLGETLVAGSPALLGWAALFLAANALWIPAVEESSLERRFGDSYRTYAANVPRWVPRRTPWEPAHRADEEPSADRRDDRT